MRRHVPAVRQQRHGAENRASQDLADHHGGCERHDPPGAPLIAAMLTTEKNMIMGPSLNRMRMHGLPSIAGPANAALYDSSGRPKSSVAGAAAQALSARIAGVRIEQLLTVDLVIGNGFLTFGRQQPVDELLAQFFLDMRVLLRVHQHDAALIEQPLVAFDRDDKIAAVLE